MGEAGSLKQETQAMILVDDMLTHSYQEHFPDRLIRKWDRYLLHKLSFRIQIACFWNTDHRVMERFRLSGNYVLTFSSMKAAWMHATDLPLTSASMAVSFDRF